MDSFLNVFLFFIRYKMITIDQIKNLLERTNALRRYL